MDTDGSPRCLDYIWVRGAVAVESAPPRVRPAGSRGPDALSVGPPRHLGPPGDRVGRAPMALRLAHRGDWRRAPENTLAAFLAALAVPGCDGLEFDVRASADGVPVVHPRRDAEAGPGRQRAGRRAVRRGARAPRRPDARRRARGGPAPRVPRRRAEGRPGARRGRRADGRPRAGPRAGGRLVVRAGRARTGRPARAVVAALAQCDGPVGRDDRSGRGSGMSGDLGRVAGRRPKAVARARAVELDLAAWTVRNRPTYGRLERLGVNADLRRGRRPSTAAQAAERRRRDDAGR